MATPGRPGSCATYPRWCSPSSCLSRLARTSASLRKNSQALGGSQRLARWLPQVHQQGPAHAQHEPHHLLHQHTHPCQQSQKMENSSKIGLKTDTRHQPLINAATSHYHSSQTSLLSSYMPTPRQNLSQSTNQCPYLSTGKPRLRRSWIEIVDLV